MRSLFTERDQKNVIEDSHRAWTANGGAGGNVIHAGGRRQQIAGNAP
jgi:hypothetical protein